MTTGLAYHLRVASGSRAGETHPLTGPVVIGRGMDASLRFLEDPYMSRAHASLTPGPQGWTVKNMSQHGIMVAGAHLAGERLLKPSEAILVGSTLLVLELVDPTQRRPEAFPEAAGKKTTLPPPKPPTPAVAAAEAPAPAGAATPAAAPAPAAAAAPAKAPAKAAEAEERAGAAVVFLPGDSREPTAEELAGYELFKGIPVKTIEGSLIKRHKINDQPPIWLRKYEPGEVICHEGEYGSTAFFITQGQVMIGINRPRREKPPRTGIMGLIDKVLGREPGEEEEEAADHTSMDSAMLIPVDASIMLPYDRPVGQLQAGDLFGEMACMSFYPRSATCVAGPEGAQCLEMLRSVLDFIRGNAKAAYKDRIEANYKDRCLDLAVRNVPFLAKLPREARNRLRPNVELITFAPDMDVFQEGDAADALYLVRLGFVKVVQHRAGGEVVLSYLGPGSYFGEVGILDGGKRTATVTSVDHVELIRIAKADVEQLIGSNPAVAAQLRFSAQAVTGEGPARRDRPGDSLQLLLEKGLMNAQNLLAIDLDRCTRCDECVRACGDSHGGVTRLIRDGLRVDKWLLATACRACTDPVCMIGCPVGSIRRQGSMQIIIEDWCIGCGKCAQQCPYGNIHMHPYQKVQKVEGEENGKKFVRRELQVVNGGKGRAATCDLCQGGEPRCVYACPHGAAKRGNPLDLFKLSGQRV